MRRRIRKNLSSPVEFSPRPPTHRRLLLALFLLHQRSGHRRQQQEMHQLGVCQNDEPLALPEGHCPSVLGIHHRRASSTVARSSASASNAPFRPCRLKIWSTAKRPMGTVGIVGQRGSFLRLLAGGSVSNRIAGFLSTACLACIYAIAQTSRHNCPSQPPSCQPGTSCQHAPLGTPCL